jgi:alkylhydroperoxidase family enzyme
MSTSPLPLPTDDELPEDVLRRLRDRPPLSIYRLIATAPQVLIPWTDMVSALYHSTVSARLREIAILRQAACANSKYELHQHGVLALSNGLSEQEVALITSPERVTSLSVSENLVCKMSEELERNGTLNEATFDEARALFDNRQFVELVTLISFYCCVARFLNATRLQIESTNPLEGHSSPN